jgi:hypothetical protein
MALSASRLVVLALAILAVAGCTQVRRTAPERAANEQLLISKAADAAIGRFDFAPVAGRKVYLDGRYFDSYDRAYAVGGVRSALLKAGGQLVANRSEAELIVEIRAGALSVNRRNFLVGLPSIEVPVPTTTELTIPEIAVFKRLDRTGVAKFAGVIYTADGTLVRELGPVYGLSWLDRRELFGVSWHERNLQPDAVPTNPPPANADRRRRGREGDG